MAMAQVQPPKWRKLVISAVAGAVIGGLGVIPLVSLFENGTLSVAGGSEAIAAILGLVYTLIALSIGGGLARPSLGAHLLNVEDEDELRQQRRMLAYAATAMAAMGLALIVLALAGPGGSISRATALPIALALFAATVPLTRLQWRHMDELMRNLSTETGNLTFYLLLLLGGGRAMLAHLDFAPAPASLDWLTMLFGLVLVASFIASGRRGMLVPR